MIVRTYGRRNRDMPRTFSDSFDDDDEDTFSLPPENNPGNHLSQDFCNFPFSHDSSSHWPSFDPDPYAFNSSQEPAFPSSGVVSRKPKKPRNDMTLVPLTSTLMEAQEFGEMMEHVDEVNFALDGLNKGQPVRIRRASLSSLLSICGTASHRRLLRTQGLAKTIIDAILGLSFDDSSSNLAAAILFYVLTSDGLDDQLLESPSSIRFLIKLLKPVTSTAIENKARNIGSKLLALRKDSDILRDASKAPDSNSTAILAKVQEILVSCKEVKLHDVSNSGAERPELNPKWIALLAMEKACLSKISFEDTTGSVRKTGGNFKEKFRELGGLDAVFEVAMNCHSVIESWLERCSPSQDSPSQGAKDGVNLQSLVLLLKCLKIMENATFLSKDNQSHLLGMRGSLNSHGCRLSFIKLIISVIKILSGLHLLQKSFNSNGGKQCSPFDGSEHGSDLALAMDFKDKIEVMSISSSSDHSEDRNFIAKGFNASQKSTDQFSQFTSTSDTSTTLTQDTLKMRIHSSMSSSCGDSLRSSSNGSLRSSSTGSRNNFGLLGKPSYSKEPACQLLVDSQDPFAFDEDEFQPSKWDLLYGKKKPSGTRKISVIGKQPENEYNYQLMSQEESSHDTSYQQKLSNGEHHSLQKNDCCSNASTEEYSSLLGDCLLTAVKVLMNLTNDNPIGCQQIAASGGLEIISALIADHFPSFGASLSLFSEMKEDTSGVELERQNDIRLADHELDFLVAILGLLVNLVEKDEQNRSRLAAATVSLPNSEGSQEESHKDVIPLLCSIFLANQGAGDASGEGDIESWNDEAALLQGEKEAEKMILEAYAALLLAFLSTESKSTREYIADHLPDRKLAILVPVLERFVAFHLTLNMISSETHKAVSEVIESCRMP